MRPSTRRIRCGASVSPPRASIAITATQEANNVLITVQDDGRGLSTERIRAKAIERGVIAPGDDIDDHRLSQIIFLPGFSTAETVTSISGRGVGLDAVKRTAEALGGSIAVESRPGQDTTFRVLLPTHVSIVDALLVAVGGVTYVVPLPEVHQVVDLPAPGSAEASRAIRHLGGRSTTFVSLSTFLPQMRALADGSSPAAVETNALVVEQDGAYIAFRVGAVLGQQDIVVRKLGAKLAALPGFTGSTILASGEPAIIISLAGLARRLQKPGEGRNREPSSNHSPKAAAGGQP